MIFLSVPFFFIFVTISNNIFLTIFQYFLFLFLFLAAIWTFIPPHTQFGNKFTFYPKEGTLRPGESETISINFESDVLGEFSEFFRFSLQGNEHLLECNIKGHVTGPTFHFDCQKIDFGIVSYDYLHTRNIRLVNTSAIPIVYNLHVPQDGTHNKKEFDILPSRGTLLSGNYFSISHFILLPFFCLFVALYSLSFTATFIAFLFYVLRHFLLPLF